MVVGDGDVAVEEQQPVVLALLSEIVAGSGTAGVGLLDDVSAVGQFVDGQVQSDRVLLRRCVVGHDDLIVDTQCRSLLL